MIAHVNKMIRANAEKLIKGDMSGIGAFTFVGEDKNDEAVKSVCIERAKKWLEENK